MPMKIDKPAGSRWRGFCGYTLIAMSPVIPFRRRSRYPNIPFTLAASAALVIGATAIAAYMIWHSSSIGPSGPIEVIDGDTVRFNGAVYRLHAGALIHENGPGGLGRKRDSYGVLASRTDP
jgi:hypothetical protein